MGWDLIPPGESWIMGPPGTEEDVANLASAACNADVAIIGISPYMPQHVLSYRAKHGKLTFIMGERYFKIKRRWRDYINPIQWRRWIRLHHILNQPSFHYLTMSHYCAEDLRFLRVCKGRIWTWGYLTNATATPPRIRTNQKMKILWCGRMFAWKRVDVLFHALALMPAQILQQCEVSIIGDGECLQDWKSLVIKLDLQSVVHFSPLMKHAEILDILSQSDVYVFPSNREEGWGATLLEAMDKGCAVIANCDAGSTLEVVDHGRNGWVIDDADVNALCKHLVWCYNEPDKRYLMGVEAWKTIQQWSPHEGASRFIQLMENVKNGVLSSSHSKGLCSFKG